MKRMKIFLGAIAFGFLGCASAVAEEKEATPMAKEMKTVSSKLKELRKMDKSDFAAGAAAVKAAHEAMLRSMAYVPSMLKDMKDGDEKSIAIADASRLLGLNYAVLCELEIAYLKKDTDLIAELAKKWKALKKEGHKKYTDD